MTTDWGKFWDRVLQPGWHRRGPAIVRNRVFNSYQIEISLEEAEDLFQSTIERVLDKESESEAFRRDPEEARKILFGYLRNVIREWWRNDVVRRKRQQHQGIEPLKEFLSVPPDLATRVYNRALDEMDETDRVIFELYYLERKTQTDVAKTLGLSLGSVNGRTQFINAKFHEIQLSVSEEANRYGH